MSTLEGEAWQMIRFQTYEAEPDDRGRKVVAKIQILNPFLDRWQTTSLTRHPSYKVADSFIQKRCKKAVQEVEEMLHDYKEIEWKYLPGRDV